MFPLFSLFLVVDGEGTGFCKLTQGGIDHTQKLLKDSKTAIEPLTIAVVAGAESYAKRAEAAAKAEAKAAAGAGSGKDMPFRARRAAEVEGASAGAAASSSSSSVPERRCSCGCCGCSRALFFA